MSSDFLFVLVQPARKASAPPRRSLLLWLLAVVGFSSLLQGVLLIVPAVINREWPAHWQMAALWIVAGVLVWSAAAVRAEWEMVLGFGGTHRAWLRGLAVAGLVADGAMTALTIWTPRKFEVSSTQMS